jgi:hypothetical protein
MTQVVCFKCGEIKWGAFNPCKKCGARPLSDDELMLSLAFSDHHFSAEQLSTIGLQFKQGLSPGLTDETRARLAPAVAEAKRICGFNRSPAEISTRGTNRGALTGSQRPTGKDWVRVVSLGLGLPVAYSLIGPIYYGYTHGPYWRVIVWALASTVIFCWQVRSSFKSALSTAPPSIIGRFLMVLAIVVVAAIGFFVGDTLVYLFVRALT